MNHVNVNTHHCVHIYCSSTEGMANQYAILKAKHPEDSANAFNEPVNPTSGDLQQKVRLVTQDILGLGVYS